MSLYIDESITRKKFMIEDHYRIHEDFPLPAVIEFSMIANCTRRCVFCPVGHDFYKQNNLKGGIEFDLFKKIVMDLKEFDYSGKLLFSGYGESLILRGFSDYIRFAREHLPNVYLELITNGDLLKEKVAVDLHDAGLDTFAISMYDGPEQIEKFSKLFEEAKIPKSKLLLRRRYKENDNWGIEFSNRGGLIDSSSFDPDKKEVNYLNEPCYYPFYMMKIDIKGDVLICSHDWNKEFIVSNCNDHNLIDIWNSDRFKEIRTNLLNHSREHSPCKTCDVKGTLMGEQFYKSWNNYYGQSKS